MKLKIKLQDICHINRSVLEGKLKSTKCGIKWMAPCAESAKEKPMAVKIAERVFSWVI